MYANYHEQPHMNDALNAITTEAGREPGVAGGRLVSNIGLFKYIYAEGDGWKPGRVEHGGRTHADRLFNPMPPRMVRAS